MPASAWPHDRGGGRDSQQTLSLGASPAARWFTSVYVAWEADDGARYAVDEWSWLNHVQLTTPGAGPIDVGLLCEIEREHDRHEGTGFTCGTTLEMDTDRLQFNLNPLLEKQVDVQPSTPTRLGYQWQVKGLFRRGIELGAQGFGTVGSLSHGLQTSQQQHTLGPAIFTKWTLPDGHALLLDAAWLAGIGGASPRDTLRVRVQHEF